MSIERTATEVEQHYSSAMGPDLGPIFNRLFIECVWLHRKWGQYRTLYGTSPQRVDLLNTAAPNFFRIVEDVLWEDTLLHLARLTDRQTIAMKDTLTLQRLPHLVKDAIKADVETLLKGATDRCAFARAWRNRHIAHRELSLALRRPATALPAVSRQSVEDALAAIVALLNIVEGDYCNSEVAYAEPSDYGDAHALLSVVRNGIEAEKARMQRILDGCATADDLRGKPPL